MFTFCRSIGENDQNQQLKPHKLKEYSLPEIKLSMAGNGLHGLQVLKLIELNFVLFSQKSQREEYTVFKSLM